MKTKRIIYLTHFSFTKRDRRRLGIEIIKSNGFDVEIWDFTPFLYPEVYKNFKMPDPIDYKKYSYKFFSSYKDALNRMGCLRSDTLIISFINFNYKTYPIFKGLSREDIPYALFISNVIPFCKNRNDSSISNKEKILDFIKKIGSINIEKIKRNIFSLIPFEWFHIDFPEFILAGGTQTLIEYKPPIGKNTKIVWGHTLDYDLYLEDLIKPSSNKLKGTKYSVFIDGYWPFTHDYIYIGVKNPIDPESYYSSLRIFFSRVEKETGFEVVIAAHPKSMYEKHQDYFGGRLIIRGRTRDLIRDSSFVLMHYSTSVNFAILYNKPVLFFITEDIERSRVDMNLVRAYTLALSKGYVNIDKSYSIDWNKELKINKEIYINYKERYIKKRGTKEKPFWQIVADEIMKK